MLIKVIIIKHGGNLKLIILKVTFYQTVNKKIFVRFIQRSNLFTLSFCSLPFKILLL
jgi:hypothetical protein